MSDLPNDKFSQEPFFPVIVSWCSKSKLFLKYVSKFSSDVRFLFNRSQVNILQMTRDQKWDCLLERFKYWMQLKQRKYRKTRKRNPSSIHLFWIHPETRIKTHLPWRENSRSQSESYPNSPLELIDPSVFAFWSRSAPCIPELSIDSLPAVFRAVAVWPGRQQLRWQMLRNRVAFRGSSKHWSDRQTDRRHPAAVSPKRPQACRWRTLFWRTESSVRSESVSVDQAGKGRHWNWFHLGIHFRVGQ